MKIRFLLIGTSLSFIPQTINAQCVATQDCATLGYTETSCSGGNGVKCPFGNKWACFKSESECEQQFCDKYGFTLTCTGSNQTGGVGKACNSKYTECTCTSGYSWDANSKTCKADRAVCEIGTLYYSDNTCSADYDSSKTLLGVVIYSNGTSGGGWIMTVKPVATGIEWGGYGTDILGLSNCTLTSCLTDIQASCTNTDVITAYGNSSTYPAAWAAKNYKPTGTPSGKSWCLPSYDLLNNLNNSINFAKVNAGITTAGGTILGNVYKRGSYYYETVWSSSEYSSDGAWEFDASTSGSFRMNYDGKNRDTDGFSVRPVLAF